MLINILIILPSVVCLFSIVKTLLLIKENRLLAGQLTEATIALQKNYRNYEKLQKRHSDIAGFQKSLADAEITTTLQQPRIHTENLSGSTALNNTAPEKYNFVHTLSEKGMDATEISSILSISQYEVQQIVNLRKIANYC